jgi:hypothetical protein
MTMNAITSIEEFNSMTVPVQSAKGVGEFKFVPITPNYMGGIPKGYDLVEVTNGDFKDAICLFGFDEVWHRPGVQVGFLRLR